MSSNSWVNYGLAAIGAVVVGVLTWGAGLSWYIPAALATFSVTATVLNAMYARPSLGAIKGMGAAAFGGSTSNNNKEAAAQGMLIASSSEAIAIPVLFGTDRLSTNYLRYDKSTFRNVPIVQRVQRDPGLVALEQAQKAYARNPSKVTHAVQSQSNSGTGGKGGASSMPSHSSKSADKVNQYAQILLQKDQTGGRKLPIEYDEYITGYKYYLSFELGICMGPVDRLERIRSFPGEGVVVDNSAVPEITTNSKAFTASGTEEGGAVRFYPGKLNQVRETGDVYKTTTSNYRGVAFAMFTDFYIGNQPTPKSYAFEVCRFPLCLDADGVALTDFPVRGAAAGTVTTIISTSWAAGVFTFTVASHTFVVGQKLIFEGFSSQFLNGPNRIVTATTPTTFKVVGANVGPVTGGAIRATHPCYYDANPAAVLYELFTNKRWGRGMSPDEIDIQSFRVAAQYFEANNIGMSFTLETQNVVSDACEIIRNHVSTLVIPVAGTLRCICLLDRSSAYTPRIRITSENVIDPTMTRPGWVSTVNELRGEFKNRLNNFQNEVVIGQDDGNLATVQRINSMKLSMPAFSNRDVADRMVRMLLGQMAYPQGNLKFMMNRFESRLEPGMFVEFVWTEWSEGPTTTFWRVAEISDQDQDEDGLEVSLIEDLYCTPVEGIPETFEAPVPAYEGGVSNDDNDLYLGENNDSPFDTWNLLFAMQELPIFLSDGQKIFALFCSVDTGRVQGVNFFARESGSGDDFTSLGALAPWAMFGTLVSTHGATGPTIRRHSQDITINLEFPNDRALFLELCSLAPTDDDDLVSLVGSDTNWLLIGNERFQVAQAEATATAGQVKCTVYIRAQDGSEMEAHAPGDRTIFCFQIIPKAFFARYDNLPINVLLEFKAIAFDLRGNPGLDYTFTGTITNRARRAMPITSWETAVAGLDWDVTFRPRFHNRGSATLADIMADANTFSAEIPDLYTFFVMPRTAGDADLLTGPVEVAVTLTPDDGEDATTGMGAFFYTAPATTAKLIFYTSYDGVLGFPVTLNP